VSTAVSNFLRAVSIKYRSRTGFVSFGFAMEAMEMGRRGMCFDILAGAFSQMGRQRYLKRYIIYNLSVKGLVEYYFYDLNLIV
jgi:hypothetical protein